MDIVKTLEDLLSPVLDGLCINTLMLLTIPKCQRKNKLKLYKRKSDKMNEQIENETHCLKLPEVNNSVIMLIVFFSSSTQEM